MAIGNLASVSVANSVAIGRLVQPRCTFETALQGMRVMRRHHLGTASQDLITYNFGTSSPEIVIVCAYVTLVSSTASDSAKQKIFVLRDYIVRKKSGPAVTSIIGVDTIVEPDGAYVNGDAVALTTSNTGNGSFTLSGTVAGEAGNREWVVCLNVWCGFRDGGNSGEVA